VRIKIDESVSRHVADVCAAFGYEADTVYDEDLVGQPDSVVLGVATRADRILLTTDRGLGDVRFYPPGSHRGIIVLRPDRADGPAIIQFIRSFLDEYALEDFRDCVVIVEPKQVRVRRPDI
jgi:predicted nuclease of predicted toxin-antitoxin system